MIRVTPEWKPAEPAAVSPLTPSAPTPSMPAQPKAVEPAAVQPVAVQPAAARPRVTPKPVAAPPSKRLNPGDLICGQCGEGNEPVRKFCSRCGQSLATATVATTSWWRKVFPRRKAKVLAAGERPRGKASGRGFSFGGLVRTIGLIVVAAILLGGLAYGAFPSFRTTVNNQVSSIVNNFTGKISAPTPVHATSVKASSAATGHDGSLAVDAFSNTFWEAPLKTDPHPTLTVGFAPGTNVSVMLFISGNTANELSTARPKALHLVFSNGASQNITLVELGELATVQHHRRNGYHRHDHSGHVGVPVNDRH